MIQLPSLQITDNSRIKAVTTKPAPSVSETSRSSTAEEPRIVIRNEALPLATLETLPPPQKESMAILQQTYVKLNAFEHDLKSTEATLKTAEPTTLFDIYALLRLLATVAQEQRDSARAMRKAASSQSKIAIQEQADLQRSSAYTGLAMGLTACALSVTMQVTNLTLSTTAKIKQDNIGKQLGLPEAQKAYAQEVKLDTANAKTLNKTVTAADKALVKALGAQDAETFKATLSNDATVVAAREQLAEARTALNDARTAFLRNPQTPESTNQMDGALERYNTAAVQYRTALHTQATRYETLAKAAPEDGTAAARAQSARAYQLQEAAALPLSGGRTGLQETPATKHFNLIQAATQYDPAFKRWATLANVSQSSTQITASIGQALNVSAQQIGQLQNATATEVGAVASKARAAADAAAAIYAQEAEILKSVLEMMKGILQAENQSMETILRA